MIMWSYPINNKVYVDVDEERLPCGGVSPRSVIWEDGKRYEIDKILCVCPSILLKTSGYDFRYTVRIGERRTFIYLENSDGKHRWFVCRKAKIIQGGQRYDLLVAAGY